MFFPLCFDYAYMDRIMHPVRPSVRPSVRLSVPQVRDDPAICSRRQGSAPVLRHVSCRELEGTVRTSVFLFGEALPLVCHVTSRWMTSSPHDHCVLFVLLGLKTEAAAQLRGVVVNPFIWRTADTEHSTTS